MVRSIWWDGSKKASAKTTPTGHVVLTRGLGVAARVGDPRRVVDPRALLPMGTMTCRG